MTEDPYRSARDVRGIGFKTADAIAMKMGVEKTSPQRLRAGVSFALQTATDEGHCGLPVAMLATLAQKLLAVDATLPEAALPPAACAGRGALRPAGGNARHSGAEASGGGCHPHRGRHCPGASARRGGHQRY